MTTLIVNLIRVMAVLIAIIMLTTWFNSEKGPVITFLMAIGLICLIPLGYYLELSYRGGHYSIHRGQRRQTKLRSRRQD